MSCTKCDSCEKQTCSGCHECQKCNSGCQVDCDKSQTYCRTKQVVGIQFSWGNSNVIDQAITASAYNGLIDKINEARNKGVRKYGDTSAVSKVSRGERIYAYHVNNMASALSGLGGTSGSASATSGAVIKRGPFSNLETMARNFKYETDQCDKCNSSCDGGCDSCEKESCGRCQKCDRCNKCEGKNTCADPPPTDKG